jgi:ABC-2 type transport system ATP-binding protein
VTLSIKQLTGGYNQRTVINEISFNVPSGSITALVGLNGSGKTTIINHIVNLLQPISGNIEFDEFDSVNNLEKYQRNISYIPETPILYEDLTLNEHLNITQKAYQLLDSDNKLEKERLLKIFRLNDKLDWFPTDFSKGMKQKVMIVSALMSNGKLLVVDEPFLGLDPLAVRDFINELKNKKKKGYTIILSTHVVKTAEDFVDNFILINKGKIKQQGNIDVLLKATKSKNIDDMYIKLAEEQ